MTDIYHSYTIQWVGPFHSFEELNEYTIDDDTCASNLFSFYFIVGNKRGKGYPRSKKDYRYLGCHKKDTSICNRVSQQPRWRRQQYLMQGKNKPMLGYKRMNVYPFLSSLLEKSLQLVLLRKEASGEKVVIA